MGERAVGHGEDDEPEDEPAPPQEEPEHRATDEDHQRRDTHGRGQPVWMRPCDRQHDRERKDQRRKNQHGNGERSGPCHSASCGGMWADALTP